MSSQSNQPSTHTSIKHTELPQFSHLDLTTFPSRLDTLLTENRNQIEKLVQQPHFTWNNLIQPLEDMDDALEHLWSPLSHSHAVVNSPKLRKCYKACLPKLSAYESTIGQNNALYNAIKAIPQKELDATQQKIIQDMLKDFELSGVALSDAKKKRFEAIQTKLSELSNQFDNHVLDATQAYTLPITDEKRLQGLPQHALETARASAIEAKDTGVKGILTLEFPCYLAVVTYAEDRALRETLYYAYVTRASDQGPNAGQYDNSLLINEMLALRHEKAQLLGFANYAELSLATKMAPSPKHVIDFLEDLLHRSYPQAQREMDSLKQFAATEYGIHDVKPWDIAYLSEKMRQKFYSLSQEALRPYFPEDTVMAGVFTIIERLYGIRLIEVTGVDTWHKDVRCYQLIDENQAPRGYLYVDLFARPNKRGGAWMDSQQSRRKRSDNSVQLPIATLTCNFAKPQGSAMATFSHDEVVTLFHELGHCLHHLLTRIDYLSASGINGVEWDAVELPSQFFENWCWEKPALALLTRYIYSQQLGSRQGASEQVEGVYTQYMTDDESTCNTAENPSAKSIKTNEPLPDGLYERLLASKNFQSAMVMIRQIEFSLFDFKLHYQFNPSPNWTSQLLAEVRQEAAVVPIAPYNRFQHRFSHIFAGGYAAGDYSYKWAEVLSSDAYSRFEEEGIFNTQTGRDFLHAILEVGGAKKAGEAFVTFRGRDPKIDALLRHSGIE